MSNATKHSVYLIVAYFITSGLNYVFGVVLSWFFAPAQFGVLGVAQSLLLLLALFVGSGFAWTAAHDIARGGIDDENRVRFRTAWLANLVIGLVMGCGVWVAYESNLLPLGPAYQTIIPLVGLTTVFLAVRAVTNGVMRGIYQFGSLSVNLILEVVIKVSAGISFVALGWGVEGVMLGFVLGAGISLIHSNLVVRKSNLWKGEGWFRKSVIYTTIPLFIGMLGTALMLNLDVLGLRLLTPGTNGDELSGFYQAAVILARVPVFLAQALTLVLFSYAAGAVLEYQDQQNRFLAYFYASLRSWFRFLVPIGMVFIFAPEDILYLMFPTQYQASSSILQLAAVGGILLALVTLLNGVMQASGQKRGAAISTAIATAVQIVVLIWLVPNFGAYGAATSLLAAGLTALTGMIIVYVRKTAEKGLTLFDREFVVKSVRGVVPVLLMILLLLLLPDGSRILILIKLSFAGIAYFLLLYFLHVNRREDMKESSNPVLSLIQLVIGV